MADELKKSVLFQIQSTLPQLKTDIIELNENLDTLQAKLKKVAEESGKNSKEYIELSSQVRINQKEIRDANRELDNTTRALDQGGDSINAYRAQLSALTAQYNEASKEQRDQLIPTIKKLSDTLKEAEKAIGDNRREVGNYAIAGVSLREKFGELNEVLGVRLTSSFEKLQSGIKSGISVFTNANKEVNTASKLYKEYQLALKEQALAERLSEEATLSLKAGTISLAEAERLEQNARLAQTKAQELGIGVTNAQTIATKALGVGFKELGIGLIVSALAGLVAYLSNTTEGAKRLKEILSVISGVFSAITEIVAPIGEAIFKAFGGSEGVVKALGDALNLVVIPLKAVFQIIGDLLTLNFTQLFKDLQKDVSDFGNSLGNTLGNIKKGVFALGDGIKESNEQLQKTDFGKVAQASIESAKARQKLTEATRDFGIESAKVEGQIETLRIKATRRDLGEKERLDALNKARSLENGLRKESVALAFQNLDVVQKEQALKSKQDLDAIADAKRRVEEEKAKQETGEARLDKLEGRINQKAKQNAEKEAREREKIREAIENSLERELESTLDVRSKELASLDNFFRKELEKVKNNEEAKEQLTKELRTRKTELNKKFAEEDEKQREALRKQFEDILDTEITNRLQKELVSIDKQTEQKIKKLQDEEDKIETIIRQQTIRIASLRKAGNNSEADDLQKALNRENEILQTNISLQATLVKDGEKKKAEAKKDAQLSNDIDRAKARQINTKGEDLDTRETSELAVLDAEYKKEVALAVKTGASLELIDAQTNAKRLEIQKKYLEAKRSIVSEEIGLVGQIAGELEKSVGKNTVAYKTLLAIQRASGVAEVIINSEKAKAKNLATYGFPAAIPLNTLVTVKEAVSVATILAQKFNQGGYVSDKKGAYVRGPGTGTSDDIPAYLSNGEAVINANSTKMFGPILSKLNVLGGGKAFEVPGSQKAFATGGIYSDGGSAQRFYNTPVLNTSALGNTLAQQLLNNPAPIYVDVKEINSVQSRRASVNQRRTL